VTSTKKASGVDYIGGSQSRSGLDGEKRNSSFIAKLTSFFNPHGGFNYFYNVQTNENVSALTVAQISGGQAN
jgi:hypothetical protein